MTFDGDPIRFWTFTKAFDNNVGHHNIAEHAKLARLLQYCEGKAYRLIESCAAMTHGGYQRARELLQERFGDTYSITTAYINRATSTTKVTTDMLQDFADEMLTLRETLLAMGCLSEINQRVLVEIAGRLPTYLQRHWKRQAIQLRETARSPSLGGFVDFVQLAAKEINDPVFGELGTSRSKQQRQSSCTQKGFNCATVCAS